MAVLTTLDSSNLDFVEYKGTSTDFDPNPTPNSRGTGNTSGSGYDTYNLTYPSDLLTSPVYGSNYVVFYINVSEDSVAATKDGVLGDAVSNLGGSLLTGLFRSLSPEAQQAVTTISGGVGGAISGALGGYGLMGRVGAGVGGLIGGALSGAVASFGLSSLNESGLMFSRANKRLKAAIALYVPNDLNINYSAQWGTVDTFLFAAAMEATSKSSTVRSMMANGQTQLPTGTENDFLAELGGMVPEFAAALGIRGDPTGGIGVASGFAPNPRKEQQFHNVNFRNFTMEYTFAPRTPQEAETVKRIMFMFKYHMHPEFISDSKFLYRYPSEFDIAYYYNGQENPNLHRHSSAVLTNVEISYTPQSVYNCLPTGMPSQIRMILQFTELLQHTKETIALGA